MNEGSLPGGRALLVLGEDDPSSTLSSATVQSMTGAALILLSCERPWIVQRLGPNGSARFLASRLNIKRAIAELADAEAWPGGVAMVVLSGAVEQADEPMLITSGADPSFPEEAGLRLSWVWQRLEGRRLGPLLLVLDLHGPAAASVELQTVAETLHRDDAPVLVFAKEPRGLAAGLVRDVFDGFRGPAADERGVITFASLQAHLQRSASEQRFALVGPPETVLSTLAPWLLDVPGLPANPPPVLTDGAEDLEGTVLPGRILVERVLGEGSFGRVYRARQLSMDRSVAVKVLRPDVDDTEERRRFAREIRMLAHLRHPQIVSIHHADVTPDGRVFFAMELLEGGTLAAELERNRERWSVDRVLDVMVPVIEGLAAAHDRGIVHSDVKPANIAFRTIAAEAPSDAVLVDFGVSRLSRARTTALGGTPRYMAPEQMWGRGSQPEGDVFSVGIVLYEMVCAAYGRTGRHPLPLQLPDDLPFRSQWVDFFELATAEDPDARPADARELLGLLSAVFNRGEEVSAMPRRPRPAVELEGRDEDIAALVDMALFEKLTVVSGRSGVGKTALVQYGLRFKLEELAVSVTLVSVHAGRVDALVDEISAPATEPADILILDQVERVLEMAGDSWRQLLEALEQCPAGRNIVLVLEESAYGRWLTEASDLARQAALHTLHPLEHRAARRILQRRSSALQSGDVERLLDELDGLAPGVEGILPVHIELVLSVLGETAPEDREVGQLRDILRAGLRRLLDRTFVGPLRAAARSMLRELFDARGHRVPRPRLLLVGQGATARKAAFDQMVRAGLLVPSTEPGEWELAHDALVDDLHEWCDAGDLGRQRAKEVLRFHLNRSEPGRWSLLGMADLREVRRYPEVLNELDEAWGEGALGSPREVPRPSALHARSWRLRYGLRWALALVMAGLLGGLSFGGALWARERVLRAADLGRMRLTLQPFDLRGLEAVPATSRAFPDLRVRLREDGDPLRIEPGPLREDVTVSSVGKNAFLIESRGGTWTLEIDGRHGEGEAPCPPSRIRGVAFPGFSEGAEALERTLRVPSCAASRSGTVEIPEGPYRSGEKGPHPHFSARTYRLKTYRIDADEMSSGLVRLQHGALSELWAHPPPKSERRGYPGHEHFGKPKHPIGFLGWRRAREVCEYFGKRLPTFAEAEKAARGGLCLVAETPEEECPSPNPEPDRKYFWGDESPDVAAEKGLVWWHADRSRHLSTKPAGAAGYESPYGVRNLAGNAFEWLADDAEGPREAGMTWDPRHLAGRDVKLIYGGWWHSSHLTSLKVGYADQLHAGNQRVYLSFRCTMTFD